MLFQSQSLAAFYTIEGKEVREPDKGYPANKPGSFEDETALDTLINQIEFVRILSVAANIEDFNKRVLRVLRPLGLTDFVFIRKKTNGVDLPSSSLPSEFLEAYLQEEHFTSDMVLDYLQADNLDPIYLSMVERVIENTLVSTQSFAQNKEIIDLYRRFDFQDVFFIPVQCRKGKSGDRGVFAVMAKGMPYEDLFPLISRSKPVLQLLADAVSFIGQDRFFAKEPSKETINSRPLRLLTTLAKNDVTLSEAADMLCVSLDTVNKHMAQAKKALGTRSQANAVYLAVQKGLIE